MESGGCGFIRANSPFVPLHNWFAPLLQLAVLSIVQAVGELDELVRSFLFLASLL